MGGTRRGVARGTRANQKRRPCSDSEAPAVMESSVGVWLCGFREPAEPGEAEKEKESRKAEEEERGPRGPGKGGGSGTGALRSLFRASGRCPLGSPALLPPGLSASHRGSHLRGGSLQPTVQRKPGP